MSEGLIQDADKARAMADAAKGDPYNSGESDGRDGAAELRSQIKEAETFVDNEDRLDEWAGQYWWLYHQGGYENEDEYLVDLDGEPIEVVPRPKQFIVKAIEKAIEYDKRAERLEYWAAVLYDFPVSDEYIRDFCEAYDYKKISWRLRDTLEHFGVNPHSLTRLEENLMNVYGAIEQWRIRSRQFNKGKTLPKKEGPFSSKELDVSSRFGLIDAFNVFDDSMIYREGSISEGEQALDPLLKADTTTIGDIIRLYRRMCASKIKALKTESELVEKFLEDIRSGRASQGRSYEQMVEDGGSRGMK